MARVSAQKQFAVACDFEALFSERLFVITGGFFNDMDMIEVGNPGDFKDNLDMQVLSP